MSFNCPSCKRPLHNPRRATCPFCHSVVDAAVRGADSPRVKVERLREDERRRRAGPRSSGFADGGSGGGTSFVDFAGSGDCGDGGGGGGGCSD